MHVDKPGKLPTLPGIFPNTGADNLPKRLCFRLLHYFFNFNYDDHHCLALFLDDGSNLRITPCSFKLGTNL